MKPGKKADESSSKKKRPILAAGATAKKDIAASEPKQAEEALNESQ